MQLEECKQQNRSISLDLMRLRTSHDSIEEKLEIYKRDKRSIETDFKVELYGFKRYKDHISYFIKFN